MHHYEQQEIAEFLAKMCIVLSARGLGRFVCLLYERWQQRLIRLLPIPRATSRSAKFRDDIAELREVIGDLWSMIRHKGPLPNYSSPMSTDLAGIQCQLTTIALCSLRDTVRQELHIPRQSDATDDFDNT